MVKQPKNYCVRCLRPTTEKKKRHNKFVICSSCRNIWCLECLSKILGLSADKAARLGAKNGLYCPLCKAVLSQKMLPKPEDIGFAQPPIPGTKAAKSLQIDPNVPIIHPDLQKQAEQMKPISVPTNPTPNTKFCNNCGASIKISAQFCDTCGVKQ